MTNLTQPTPTPAPGSDAARKAGCTCPFLTWSRRGVSRYKVDGKWTPWIDSNCPVHGEGEDDDPLPDLTMRPRTAPRPQDGRE